MVWNRRTYGVFVPLAQTTLAAAATSNVDIDLIVTQAPQICFITTYGTIAAGAGLRVTLFPGFDDGTGTGNIVYADNGNEVTEMVDPTANGQTVRIAIALDTAVYPRYVRARLVNKDASHSITEKIVGVT